MAGATGPTPHLKFFVMVSQKARTRATDGTLSQQNGAPAPQPMPVMHALEVHAE